MKYGTMSEVLALCGAADPFTDDPPPPLAFVCVPYEDDSIIRRVDVRRAVPTFKLANPEYPRGSSIDEHVLERANWRLPIDDLPDLFELIIYATDRAETRLQTYPTMAIADMVKVALVRDPPRGYSWPAIGDLMLRAYRVRAQEQRTNDRPCATCGVREAVEDRAFCVQCLQRPNGSTFANVPTTLRELEWQGLKQAQKAVRAALQPMPKLSPAVERCLNCGMTVLEGHSLGCSIRTRTAPDAEPEVTPVALGRFGALDLGDK